ncbi:uncharacterized protein K444DRAFT_480632, partial [Hyaloscypha bicolor E]
IYLFGHDTTVRRNLSAALYALRDKKEARILWIDAPCINQNDDEEKVSQVMLMEKIYD